MVSLPDYDLSYFNIEHYVHISFALHNIITDINA